jgi:predicted MFS family arabinose efflux permease
MGVGEVAPTETDTPVLTARDANAPSLWVRWYVLVMMCGVYTFSIADRYMISTLLEPIRLELKLSDAGIGFLTGVSLALFYVTLGFPLSWLIDRSNRRNIIAFSVIVWSAMTALCGLARTYLQFLLARVGVGIGEAGGTPGANSIIADYFPARRRPMALAVFSLGAPLGAWVAASVAGSIAGRSGWRAAFLWLGVPGLLFGLLLLCTIREPQRGQCDVRARSEGRSLWQALQFLLRQRSAMHLVMAIWITALWGWGLVWWTPAYLMRNFGMSIAAAGDLLGPMHLVGGGLATVATAWLMARPILADSRRILRVLGVYVALATVATFVIYSTHSLRLAVVLFWFFIPAIYVYIGPTFGILLNLAEPGMRAQFCAIDLFGANICNLIVAPQVVGLLSDWFAPGHVVDGHSLRLAMLCLVPTGLWAAYHYFGATRALVEDQQRAVGSA